MVKFDKALCCSCQTILSVILPISACSDSYLISDFPVAEQHSYAVGDRLPIPFTLQETTSKLSKYQKTTFNLSSLIWGR